MGIDADESYYREAIRILRIMIQGSITLVYIQAVTTASEGEAIYTIVRILWARSQGNRKYEEIEEPQRALRVMLIPSESTGHWQQGKMAFCSTHPNLLKNV